MAHVNFAEEEFKNSGNPDKILKDYTDGYGIEFRRVASIEREEREARNRLPLIRLGNWLMGMFRLT